MKKIKLDTLTYPDIESLISEGKTSLLWPVGTLEAHGRHSPVGTDNFCAEEIAWRLGERLDWPVAPTLNYGITTGLIAYPGSVRIDKDLYFDLCTTIIENFFQMGFRRIAIINGHGGNTETLTQVIKELILEDRGNRHLLLLDWWQLDADALAGVYGRPGGHAALDETACVSAFRPETLKPENLEAGYFTKITPGVVSAPYSAAVITYSEGDATPDFDQKKAQLFMNKVIDKLEAVIRIESDTFEKSFGSSGA